ncbi:MAG: DUF2975 domain-containing protein [Clostridiales Family XIII bacterium]|jgi:hypothetical protein|nr:DUF2975 domain-containing protein [Clostridiales Family XIII bacterium]
MWNKYRSVSLSFMCTKLVIALVFVFAAGLPFIYKFGVIDSIFLVKDSMIPFVTVLFYICCVLALIALFSLHSMLAGIRKDLVFVDANVHNLRRISWCCFAVSVVLIAGTFANLAFWVIAAMAAFIGLILRVVKNVFEAAVAIKTENDFTV